MHLEAQHFVERDLVFKNIPDPFQPFRFLFGWHHEMSRYAGMEELRQTQVTIWPHLTVMAKAIATVCSYPVWRRHFAGWAAGAIGSA
jgi:hypothetical protein